MSLQSALINLVRKSYVSASVEHDYATPGELGARHDEIAFVDPHGDPCAIPTAPTEDVIDHEYQYATGARGHQLRGTLVGIGLAIDYIDNTLKRTLDQWKRERANVWVSPNLGRNTLFSWRAVDMKAGYFNGGPVAKDLTGNHLLMSTCGAYLRYWDTARRLLLPKTGTNRTPLVQTPGGAGLVSFPTCVNRMRPTYPKSATLGSGATESGWIKGGAGAANITAALNTNGFGQTDCPHSLTVSVAAAVSSDQYVAVVDQFNPGSGAGYAGYTFINGTAATAIVWLRGQLPDNASLIFGNATGTDWVVRSLAGARFDGWTPVAVSHTPSAWATNYPSLFLTLYSTTGIPCSFEIGPTMVIQQTGFGSMPAAAVWSAEMTTGGTSSGAAQVGSSASVTLPGQGTIIVSYYAPSDFADAWRTSSTVGLFGNTNLRLAAVITDSTELIKVSSVSPAQTLTTVTGARGTLIQAGKINTIAVTWDGSSQKIYANGELALTAVTGGTTVPFGGSSSALTIGREAGGYACSPLAMLTARIDEGAMTATQVGQIHTALTDPIALSLAVSARGRTFRITRTPQSLRASAGGSQILGEVQLEQVDYDPFTADPFAKEASIL